MTEPLSATQAAERLGLPKTTVVSWLRSLPIDANVDSRGRYRIGSDALNTLARVQSLRGDGAGFDTIRQTLKPGDSHQEAQTGPDEAELFRLLREERERSANLSERVAELSAVAAAHQARASMLAERVVLLEAATIKRPWWKLWK